MTQPTAGRGGTLASWLEGRLDPTQYVDVYPPAQSDGRAAQSYTLRDIASRGLVLILVSLLLMGSGCGPEQGQCRDGTHTTATGRGACSHHGGLK
jgi:hypothetical protein